VAGESFYIPIEQNCLGLAHPQHEELLFSRRAGIPQRLYRLLKQSLTQW
jgi:hypothetical protein